MPQFSPEKGIASFVEAALLEQVTPGDAPLLDAGRSRRWVIGLTSLFFILLQSACTAFMALSGLRLIIGLGSLAAAATDIQLLGEFHTEAIRIPMEIVAVAGSVLNLAAILRVRSLRARPSSQWRMAPVSAGTKRAEWIQVALAVLTLVLVALEWMIHIHLHGTI